MMVKQLRWGTKSPGIQACHWPAISSNIRSQVELDSPKLPSLPVLFNAQGLKTAEKWPPGWSRRRAEVRSHPLTFTGPGHSCTRTFAPHPYPPRNAFSRLACSRLSGRPQTREAHKASSLRITACRHIGHATRPAPSSCGNQKRSSVDLNSTRGDFETLPNSRLSLTLRRYSSSEATSSIATWRI